MKKMDKLLKASKDILVWWEDAQYLETIPGHNAFDDEEDDLFGALQKAVEEITNG